MKTNKHPLIGQTITYHKKDKAIRGIVVDSREGELLNIKTMGAVKGVAFKVRTEDGKYFWTTEFPEEATLNAGRKDENN